MRKVVAGLFMSLDGFSSKMTMTGTMILTYQPL